MPSVFNYLKPSLPLSFMPISYGTQQVKNVWFTSALPMATPKDLLPSGKQRQPYLVSLASFLLFFLFWVYNCQKQLCALPMPSLKTNRAITYKTSILLLNLFLIILQDGKRNALAVNTGSVGPTVDIEQTRGNTSKIFFRLPWFNGRYSWLWVNSAISLCDRINDRLPLLILGHNVWNAASKINAVFSLYLVR